VVIGSPAFAGDDEARAGRSPALRRVATQADQRGGTDRDRCDTQQESVAPGHIRQPPDAVVPDRVLAESLIENLLLAGLTWEGNVWFLTTKEMPRAPRLTALLRLDATG